MRELPIGKPVWIVKDGYYYDIHSKKPRWSPKTGGWMPHDEDTDNPMVRLCDEDFEEHTGLKLIRGEMVKCRLGMVAMGKVKRHPGLPTA